MIVIIMTSTAFILSIALALIDKYINKKNMKLEKLINMLPGYNCGTCGYVGCSGMAEAIIENKNSYKKCRVMKEENKKILENYLDKN